MISFFPDVCRRVFRSVLALGIMALLAVGCGGGSDAVDPAPAAPADEHDDEESAVPGRIALTEAAYRTAAITVETVGTARSDAAFTLDVPGHVEVDPRRVVVVSSRIAGRVERLSVVEGDQVHSGAAIAWLYSAAFLTAQQDYLQALRRAQRLTGTSDEAGAGALASAARQRLETMGAAAGMLDSLAAGGAPNPLLVITAPFGGSIMESHTLAGSAIEPGVPLYTLADLSVVDVVASVPERWLPQIRVGQKASVMIAAFPEMRFTGQVERLRDQLDPETRTMEAVIHVPNPRAHLRPGMYATVQLDAPSPVASNTGAASRVPVLSIPESAVTRDGNEPVVFVETAPRTFERREVEIAPAAATSGVASGVRRVIVRNGLVAGERVAISGVFTLKSELAKAGLSHDH